MPTPVSATDTSTIPSFRTAPTSMRPPSGVNFNALGKRTRLDTCDGKTTENRVIATQRHSDDVGGTHPVQPSCCARCDHARFPSVSFVAHLGPRRRARGFVMQLLSTC